MHEINYTTIIEKQYHVKNCTNKLKIKNKEKHNISWEGINITNP